MAPQRPANCWLSLAQVFRMSDAASTKRDRSYDQFTYWDTAIANLQALEALGIEQAFVLGTSQGGWIAARMAMLDPNVVQGIIPLGTSMDNENQRSRDPDCCDGIKFCTPVYQINSHKADATLCAHDAEARFRNSLNLAGPLRQFDHGCDRHLLGAHRASVVSGQYFGVLLARTVTGGLERRNCLMSSENEQAPKILDLPIGLHVTGEREEFDSMGTVMVPAEHYWGAQTQRSLIHFDIGHDKMPVEVYRAYGYVKKAAAVLNTEAGRLPAWKGKLIDQVCDEVISGALDAEFPLYVWQTGSGTQSNMNVNEVISNRCIQLVEGTLGSQEPVHPNDHVNMCQSSNDTFPTAMHIAAYKMTTETTLPALRRFHDALERKSRSWEGIVKIGRTHLEDATPLTVAQEWSGYAGAVRDAITELEHATSLLLRIAMGGTAVGTGLNTPAGFDKDCAKVISSLTGYQFETADNKFTAQGTLDRMVRAHAGLKTAAVTCFKIANDMRWLGSGPRAGIMEMNYPANEPGSSIMPGKVNPTQAEAMLMVCIQIMASDVAVQMGGAEGNFELNAFRPLLIHNYLHSALILGDMCDHMRKFMIEGAEVNRETLTQNIDNSLMMVTALSPIIGYDQASAIAHYAQDNGLTLKKAALAKGVSEELFDKIVVPIDMTHPGPADSGNK
jgi:fumarate hydratase, class II